MSFISLNACKGLAVSSITLMVLGAPPAHADLVRFNFEAAINGGSAGLSDYVTGTELSGYFEFDSDVLAHSIEASQAYFDLYESPLGARLYIDQIDTVFDLDDVSTEANAEGNNQSYYFSGWKEEEAPLVGIGYVEFVLKTNTSHFGHHYAELPSAMEVDAIDSAITGEFYFANDPDSSAYSIDEFADLSFTSLGSSTEVPLPAAVWMFGSALLGLTWRSKSA